MGCQYSVSMHGMNYCDVAITWLSSYDSSFECDRPESLV